MSITAISTNLSNRDHLSRIEEEELLRQAQPLMIQPTTIGIDTISPCDSEKSIRSISVSPTISKSVQPSTRVSPEAILAIPHPESSSHLGADSISTHSLFVKGLQKHSESLAGDKKVTAGNGVDEISFEELFQQVMMTIIHQTQGAILSQKELMKAEREWQNKMHEELISVNQSLSSAQKATSIVSHITKLIGPLAMIVSGATAILTGGISLAAIGVAVLGGLITVDAILDDAAKKAAASWLAQQTGETQEAWLSRIHIFSSVTTLLAGLGFDQGLAIKTATSVAQIAAEGARAGVDWREKSIKALHTEIEHHLELSGKTSDKQLKSLKEMGEMVIDLYKAIQQVHKSTMNTQLSMARRA